jgi:hypothetical protein
MPGARWARILVAIVTILLVASMILGSALAGLR